jgi:hypothetical protein
MIHLYHYFVVCSLLTPGMVGTLHHKIYLAGVCCFCKRGHSRDTIPTSYEPCNLTERQFVGGYRPRYLQSYHHLGLPSYCIPTLTRHSYCSANVHKLLLHQTNNALTKKDQKAMYSAKDEVV